MCVTNNFPGQTCMGGPCRGEEETSEKVSSAFGPAVFTVPVTSSRALQGRFKRSE